MRKKVIGVNDVLAKVDVKHKWTGNILQKIAEEVVRYTIPVEEIIKNDLSVKLLKELEREVKNGEIISMQVNAKPRMAKSTLAILLSKFIHSLLIKYKMKDENDKFGMKNIARDQNERIKKMRNPDLMYDIIMTDESNSLEDTGENATVEKAQRDVFSDVQAGRYIHGIWVCPEGTMDKNTDIKLEIRNKSAGLVHCRVYYYSRSQYYYGWVLIGIADYDVKNLIKNWLKVEPVFMRYIKKRNKKDKEFIKYWSSRDFYVEYMCKKYEKMELMNREGILHARDLDYADIRRDVIDSLKPIAKLQMIPMQRLRNNIKSRIEIEFGKRSMPLSIIGKEMEYNRVSGFLDMYRSLVEIESSLKIVKNKFKKGKMDENEYHKTVKVLCDSKEEITSSIKDAEERINRLVELNKKYNEHLI